MDKKEQILHYHRIDGLSLREIARKTGLNRKTVTRYRQIRMRGARHINFDQIKVALETRDAAPLTFTDSQRTDAFLKIEIESEDVLAQLDGIMQGNAGGAGTGRRCAP